MEIKLSTLSIKNFKGIKEEYFDFKNSSAEIIGANASGKTSVYDALLWLLTGKNSEDSTDFAIKPIDLSGNKIIGVIPEVKATLLVNGQEVELSKRLEEVWKKKTGEVEKSYDSDSVNAFIDGVPRKIDKEYNEFIRGLVGDDTILKIGLYYDFFMNMHFKDKRNVLLSLTTVNPDEQLEKTEKFKNINSVLKHQSVEDAKKRLQEEKRRLKKDYDGIPERIDELKNTVVTVNERDVKNAEDENKIIEEKKLKIKKVIDDLIYDKNSDTKKIADEIQALVNEKNKYESKIAASLWEEKTNLSKKMNKIISKNGYSTLETIKQNVEYDISKKEEELKVTRVRWKSVFNEEYTESDDCPTCGQKYPDSFTKNKRDAFDSSRKSRLSKLEEYGKQLSEEIDEKKKEVNELEEKIKIKKEESEKDLAEISTIKESISDIDKKLNNISSDEEVMKYVEQVRDLELKLKEYDVSAKIKEHEDKIKALNIEQDEIKEIFIKAKSMESTQSRIKELENEYKEIGKQLLGIDIDIQLIEDFNSERCKLLEDEINAHFKTIKWKLFEIQKNGGIKDVCIATVDGVDYTDLNNAARINAGIETSNTITKMNDVRLPMFIDNAESIINSIDTRWQMIFLTVSKDKKLKFKRLEAGVRTWGLN